MKLTFLGTKGMIDINSPTHRWHSSLLVEKDNFRLLVDHGIESEKLAKIKPDAILITHAHPDHFIWLKSDEKYDGKIYATKETINAAKFMRNFAAFKTNQWFTIGPFKIFAYPLIHSLIAPTVGLKIKNTGKTISYNPDIIAPENKDILKNIDLYIGDGASVTNNIVRRQGDKLFGHGQIQTQLNWCKKYKIKKAIITHFGKKALRIGDKKLAQILSKKNPELKIKIAEDKMKIKV